MDYSDISLSLFYDKILPLISNVRIKPVFTPDGNFFFTEQLFEDDKLLSRYVYVDAHTGEKQPLFDHEALARQLSTSENSLKPYQLPIQNVSFSDGKLAFSYAGKQYAFQENELTPLADALPDHYLLSPDGKKAAFARDHNLFYLDLEAGKEVQLTTEGCEHHAYAGPYEANADTITLKRYGRTFPCNARWSPDSRYLLTSRIDEREVKDLYLLQSVVDSEDKRPVLHTYKCAFPFDEAQPTAQYFIADTVAHKVVQCDIPDFPVDVTILSNRLSGLISWSDQSSKALVFWMSRNKLHGILYEIDPQTGNSRVLVEEISDSFIFTAFFKTSNMLDDRIGYTGSQIAAYYERENLLFWMSESDGNFHIYAYDPQKAQMLHQVTRGDFVVRQFLGYQRETQTVYFTASGVGKEIDPYFIFPYAIQLDGSGMTRLADEPFSHQVILSPGQAYFTDSYSAADAFPTHVLRSIDGSIICELASCDAERLLQAGYRHPVPFKVKGADGVTDVYGILTLPPDLDPSKKYPVMEFHYGGVQSQVVPHDFAAGLRTLSQCAAQAGFIGVSMDGRGSTLRSKSFHNLCFQNLRCAAGLVDHVAAYDQLCETYPFIDKDRIGIYGWSGGGYGSLVALIDFPDTYKVAVSTCGNHYSEMLYNVWADMFMGDYDRELLLRQGVEKDIPKLRGKLLIGHGDLDDNVSPANTLRIVDALIKAEKDFEMFIHPNQPHVVVTPYYLKKIIKFFLENL